MGQVGCVVGDATSEEEEGAAQEQEKEDQSHVDAKRQKEEQEREATPEGQEKLLAMWRQGPNDAGHGQDLCSNNASRSGQQRWLCQKPGKATFLDKTWVQQFKYNTMLDVTIWESYMIHVKGRCMQPAD